MSRYCCCKRKKRFLGEDPLSEETEFSPTYFVNFKGVHKDGEVYEAHNTRPIDLVTELFGMLESQAMYGQPGTDGSFVSNFLETIKNDNDVWSICQLNPAHPFQKSFRNNYLTQTISLSLYVNTIVGKKMGYFSSPNPYELSHYIPSIIASITR